MTVIEAIIIGILQGLTEFLPVSSSGHILLAERLLGLDSELSFTLMMHVATLLAVAIVMRKEIFAAVTNPKKLCRLGVATLMSALVIFALGDLLKSAFDIRYLPIFFLITAIMLLISGFVKPKKKEIDCFDAAIIGLTQGFAVLPGISRSGSTVAAATLLGNEKNEAVSFSFLLSIPIIVGSALIDFLSEGFGSVRVMPLIFGFIAAFISGICAVKIMMKLTKASFDVFAVYLTVLSAFLIINDLWLHLF